MTHKEFRIYDRSRRDEGLIPVTDVVYTLMDGILYCRAASIRGRWRRSVAICPIRVTYLSQKLLQQKKGPHDF